MKIILIQINFSEDHSEKILPLGILSVGSALKKNGLEVELVNISEKEIEGTVEQIIKQEPLLISFSVMTGRQTKHSAQMSKLIKEKSSVLILWGGIHPSLLPEQCLAEDYIDLITIGEGEETIIELVQKLEKKESLDTILGLGFKKDGRIKLNPARPLIKDLDQWPLDFSLLDMEKYIYKLDRFKRVIAYKASRGCPFNCAFCYNRQFNKNKWRAWSVEHVVSDVEFLKKEYKIEAIKFYDDNFFVDKARALEILKRVNLPSHLEIRIDMIDEDLVKGLKEARVFDLAFGVESGSNRILNMINKGITVEKILRTVKLLSKYDMSASYSVIVGFPTETKEEFNATLDLLYGIYKIHPSAFFTLGAFLPYPGSLMYNMAIEAGFKPPAKTEDWGKIDRFRKDFSSPWVDGGQVWIIRECFKLLKFKLGPIKKVFEFRIEHRFFSWPIDIYLIEFFASLAIEERNWFGRILRRGYNFIKQRS